MRYGKAAFVAVSLVLGACTAENKPSVTEPVVRSTIIVQAACDPVAASQIASSLHGLFDPPEITQAVTLWTAVVAACPGNLAQARENLMEYVQYTIDQLKLGNVKNQPSGTPADAIRAHWDTIFPYVGYSSPGLPSDVFGPEGAAGVITQSTQNRELAAATAAITVPVQDALGDQRGHLFVIYPIAAGCLTGTNLQQSGPCFEFASFPSVAPAFSPKVKVGICQPVDENDALPQNAPGLGHLTGGFVKVPSQAQYPTFCTHLDEVADAGSWQSVGGIAKRLAFFAKKAVGVQPLYAVHGGLGGLGGTLSPFGAVDLMVFQASLENQSLGAPPSADAGNWTLFATPPGSITVQPSLGSYNDTIIVLRQGGGNCANCGGLMLRANLFAATGSSGADLGTYDVSWISLQDKSGAKGAPFVLRDAATLEIARIAYVSTKTNKTSLQYNGVEVGSWVRGNAQRFKIRVNLDTRKTTLFIDDVEVATNRNFVQNAQNLATLGAEFSGIDSGIIGWGEIAIQRIADE